MRTTHPDGDLDLFMVKGTTIIGTVEAGYGTWISFGRHGSDGLNIDDCEWDAFAKLVTEMDKYIKKARDEK